MKIAATVVTLALLVLPSIRGAEPTPDFFLGHWVFDAKASTYPAGTLPRSMTIDMSSEPRGIHYHSALVAAKGIESETDYTGHEDGKPIFVNSSLGVTLPVTLRRIDDHHVTATYSNGFQVAATSQRTLSADNNTLTITTVSKDKLGQTQTTISIYHRALR